MTQQRRLPPVALLLHCDALPCDNASPSTGGRVTSPRQGHRNLPLLVACLSLLAAACEPEEAPEQPLWSDVEPILRAQCGSCHGSSASVTGGGVRFDFYDLSTGPCGQAGMVLDSVGSARAQRAMIAEAITTTDENVRPIMPPLPAPYLTDREWLTILRWAANPFKGDKPEGNLPPRISLAGTPFEADRTLDVRVVVEDPEGEPVVGLLKVGDQIAQMDRAGSFAARYDTSSWPDGIVTISATLCDGWSQVYAPLLTVLIKH